MLVNGKAIRNIIKEELRLRLEASLMVSRVSIADIVIGQSQIVDTFVAKKRKFAEDIGINFSVFNFAADITLSELSLEIEKIVAAHDGVIIQLPLPAHLPTLEILNKIPRQKDIDCLSEEAHQYSLARPEAPLPPVAGSLREIINFYQVSLIDKKIVVLGNGTLVGKPVITWLASQNLNVEIFDKEHPIDLDIIHRADLIISGVGQAGLITPDMVKEGVIIIDAGTSSEGGTVSGDARPEVSQKSALFTSVPGGVGPITIACLYKNLLDLNKIPQLNSNNIKNVYVAE